MKRITVALIFLSLSAPLLAQPTLLNSQKIADLKLNHLTIQEFVTALTKIVGNLGCLALAQENPCAVSAQMTPILNNLLDMTCQTAQQARLTGTNSLQDLLTYLKQSRPALHQKGTPDIQPDAIETFTFLMGSFAQIFCSPQNRTIVSNNVRLILARIMNLMRKPLRKSPEISLCITKEFEKEFTDIILHEALMLQK